MKTLTVLLITALLVTNLNAAATLLWRITNSSDKLPVTINYWTPELPPEGGTPEHTHTIPPLGVYEHSVSGEYYGPPPGGTVFIGFIITRSATTSELVGNSYVELVETADTWFYEYLVADGASIDHNKSVEPARAPTDDSLKTVWKVQDTAITTTTNVTSTLYREGVDKIVAAVTQSGGSGGSSDMTATNALLTSIKNAVAPTDNQAAARTTYIEDADTAATGIAADLQSTGSGKGGMVGMATLTDPSLPISTGSEFKFAENIEVLGHTFKFQPFAFVPDLAGAFTWIREITLWGMMIAFVWFCNRELKSYVLAYYATAQAQTKVEPSQVIPLVGWVKQGGLAAALAIAMIAAVGASIAAMNSGLGLIISGGTSVWNVQGTVSTGLSGLSSTFVEGMKIVNRAFPIYAALQFTVTQWVIAFGMPIIWSKALTLAKVLQP